eukprot:TRINITY_DN1200_c0_g1_i1.p1 TRINITY_DN1200_c0_g1~~TRINITY_DN1200_c0_g1_i1.p1  ORF type:complete len:475 (+),score=81.16 TRINITY_DN1200_c0_g1_i1:43-1467(+)
MARLGSARLLTEQGALKPVLHLEIELDRVNGGMLYQPGDAIGIHCPNPYHEVHALLQYLQLDPHLYFTLTPQPPNGSVPSHLNVPCTLEHIFMYCVDIMMTTSPAKKAFLRLLAEYCLDAQDKTQLYILASREGSERYNQEILVQRPTLLELLQRYPSCRPPLEHLLPELPPLMHRLYSISNAPSLYPNTMHVAVSLVQFTSGADNHQRYGLCSWWLYHLARHANLIQNDYLAPSVASVPLRGYRSRVPGQVSIPVFIKRARDFRLPENSERPLIMVGPGTGVSPFRGFLQQRAQQQRAFSSGASCLGWWRGMELELDDEAAAIPSHSSRVAPSHQHQQDGKGDEEGKESPTFGPTTLFFGCRHRDVDFLYRHDLEVLAAQGALTHLHCAFSRETPDKVYVQQRLREQGSVVARQVLEQDAFFFVCGDGSRMAVDVQNTLVSILSEHGAMDIDAARKYVLNMIKEKRYVADIWS